MQKILFRLVGHTRLIPFTELTGFSKDPRGSEAELRKAAESASEVDSRIIGYELVEDLDDV